MSTIERIGRYFVSVLRGGSAAYDLTAEGDSCWKKSTGRFVKREETGYGVGVGNFTATSYER